MVFNLNPHEGVEDDIKIIRAAFPQTYVYHLPNYNGYVVAYNPTTQIVADVLDLVNSHR